MQDILLLSSEKSMTGYAGHFEDVLVKELYMEEALRYIRNDMPPSCKVVIARGNTAGLLQREKLQVPLVIIDIKDSELIASIEEAKSLFQEPEEAIAYIGVEDTVKRFGHFLKLIHNNIKLYPVKDSADIKQAVKRAKRNQVKVLIGGRLTQSLAEAEGIKAVLLKSSETSVKEAYDRAKTLRDAYLIQQRKIRERNLLFDSIDEGLVSIDRKRRITLCNDAAENIFGLPSKMLIGKEIRELFDTAACENIVLAMSAGRKFTNLEVAIKNRRYVISVYPIRVRQELSGAAVNLKYMKSSDEIISVPYPGKIFQFPELVGNSMRFNDMKMMAIRFSKFREPKILFGENGCGKSVLAECIHSASVYAQGLFISRDAELLETDDFIKANGGTLFIRNAHKLSTHIQIVIAEYLRIGTIETGQHVTGLADGVSAGMDGYEGSKRRSLNMQLIFSTDQNLTNFLMPELYYRVNTLKIYVPALRERGEDYKLLAQAFIEKYNLLYDRHCSISPSLFGELKDTSWKGNILELESYIRQRVLMAEVDEVSEAYKTVGYVTDEQFFAQSGPMETDNSVHRASTVSDKGFVIKNRFVSVDELKELERYYKGKKSAIAEHLGISRATLWRYYKEMDDLNHYR